MPDPASLRAALAAFLTRSNLKPDPLEKAAKIGGGAVRKFLDGKSGSLNGKTYAKLATGASKLLGREVGIAELIGTHIPVGAVSQQELPIVHGDFTGPALILWRVGFATSRQPGGFVLYNENTGELPRPARVAHAKRAFACKLLDDANGPAYGAGHIIVVDPDAGARLGSFCVFTNDPGALGGAASVAAFLVGVDDASWEIEQGGVRRRLDRTAYPEAWPVVAHYPEGL